MPRIANNRAEDPDSYDVWDSGTRSEFQYSFFACEMNRSLPLLPSYFMDFCRNDKRWFQHINYHSMALELILTGAMEYRTETQTRIASKGMLYVVARGSNVRMVNSGNRQRRKLCLLITGSCLDSIAASLGFATDQLLTLSDPDLVETKLREIAEDMKQKKNPEILSEKVYSLLLLLSREKKQIPDILQPALLMIDNSPSKNFTIQKLASACGLSESTFRRYFRNAFGISPAVYIRNRRLKLSAEMLCSSKEQIKGIALRCGFPAAQYFSAVFKTHYGITPADYRRQQRQAFAASQQNEQL